MSEIHELGKQGEQFAISHLLKQGYRILEQNWRIGRNEIDIIARDGNFLVIVEVKTRSSSYSGEPEMFVTRQKQKTLIRAANAYIKWHKIDLETRFDIVAIIISSAGIEINHIKDAFYPTL
ncbi:MAG: YraN family protein [Bacteroidetes bacterium]|nr:YraN family protein [Bacteroidota bacterium]